MVRAAQPVPRIIADDGTGVDLLHGTRGRGGAADAHGDVAELEHFSSGPPATSVATTNGAPALARDARINSSSAAPTLAARQ
jgi:hypothetical protein